MSSEVKRSFPPRISYADFVEAVDAYVRARARETEHHSWLRHHRWENRDASAQIAQASIVEVEVAFRVAASDEAQRIERFPLTTEGAAGAAQAIIGALTLFDDLGNAHE